MIKVPGRKELERSFSAPIVRLLIRTGVTPNALTWTGFLFAVAAAAVIGIRQPFIGAWVMLVGSIFDMLDGSLARATNRVSIFGAFLDSTLDRLSESAILLGVIILYAGQGAVLPVALAGAALIGSLLVSYIRARAEGVGLKCEVGIFTRPERVGVLALGLLLFQFKPALVIALGIIAFLSFFTAGQRLFHVWRLTK